MIVDLNSDLGEGCANDQEIMKYITSANIACGFHAGDIKTIERTIKLALENNVAIGAHPGYPDKEGFGRKSMKFGDKEFTALIFDQVKLIKSKVEDLGGKLQHVKLHGAMYNDIAGNYQKAKIAAETIARIDPNLIFVGLAGSEMIRAAKEAGLKTAQEVFADRAYNDDGTLVSRSVPNSVIHDTEVCLERIEKMVTRNEVQSINNKIIKIKANTICVHGDNIKAVEFVKVLSKFLLEKGIELKKMNKLIL
jgi:UPF0271 protein